MRLWASGRMLMERRTNCWWERAERCSLPSQSSPEPIDAPEFGRQTLAARQALRIRAEVLGTLFGEDLFCFWEITEERWRAEGFSAFGGSKFLIFNFSFNFANCRKLAGERCTVNAPYNAAAWMITWIIGFYSYAPIANFRVLFHAEYGVSERQEVSRNRNCLTLPVYESLSL